MRVLCVDDNRDMLDLTKTFLEDSGMIDVKPVSSAISALELLRKERYDAIISDYYMPKMNGIDLLKTLRREGDRIPFVFLTASRREEVVIEAVNNGANSYIQKGADGSMFNVLRSALVQLSQKNEAERAIARRGDTPKTIVYDSLGAASLFRAGTLVHANMGCARLFGYERVTELMDQPALAWALPELREEVLDRLLKLELRRTPNFIHVMPVRRADGSRFKVMVNDTNIRLEDGPACLVRYWDIPEQGRAGRSHA
jgi:PAS domain S-box-containing protein